MIFFFLFFPRTFLSRRFSRCARWLSLLEGSRDNWNIPSLTCQRGWKLSVIYNNRPSMWCFYPCHLWLKLLHSSSSLHFLILNITQICSLDQSQVVFISSFFPFFGLMTTKVDFFVSTELQHLELTVCLLWRFKRGPGVTFAHGSSVQCSLGQTQGPKCGSFCCQQSSLHF